MIEVYLEGNRWAWRLIAACGRALIHGAQTYPCDHSAASAAKDWRSAFWAVADGVDHRHARCI